MDHEFGGVYWQLNHDGTVADSQLSNGMNSEGAMIYERVGDDLYRRDERSDSASSS